MTDTARKILEALGWKAANSRVLPMGKSGRKMRATWEGPDGYGHNSLPDLDDLNVLDRMRCEWARERKLLWKESGPGYDGGYAVSIGIDQRHRPKEATASKWIKRMLRLAVREPDAYFEILCRNAQTRIEAIQKAWLAAVEAEGGV